ncbi:hypothetical protein A3C09_04325 [Candidatus Uhrbacteria bacterium RIFCSPHIGHO2_02_FULL_47_44]|uniref:50S ribosomal protein L7/L12 n=1 Tax=Candidatus Uhrbacteria bacterium RIFCSPLOWO2_02_FULL_48_18 TaxID=1802408 RepID=A0A1F7V8B3_9BACT|nr:MAG: hypothetical protein A2839_02670 [Candidatus Uhrbacteria bacterium RIFCSPHIGHO2_01_FULL_47_10]OGL70766.1 MAG: hypothetical protein A3C09_04325 [Candidatus Uhrbacteria bacterium RIFCSPHIGHO2_02_FULL_47_44]OGL76507.1 MAG: hypothetical protein A3E97_03505 [Candidatus Uhrbacteria bacterium RIFCSPHIGHO2_12_FULL_47_12]OGL82230.1 MAG: hypothetical protein A3B20_00550 [Candidatus Uhrbacteria bacterium RIFCSPLOWO2_01_FULL_47_17]OGL86720.1 MAG: hypothetical protein A3I41_05315 [Candidatus Uhrbact
MNEDEFEFEPDPFKIGGVPRPRGEDPDVRSKLALQMLKQVQQSLAHVIQLLEDGDTARATLGMVNFVMGKKAFEQTLERETGARTHEGVFDGMFVVTSEGARHPVPENYASKSKLVEGDMMKLIVTPDGRHVYKQIAPVERKRIVGVLGQDILTNTPVVMVQDVVYKVLQASVSYFKAVPGDEVVILVPGSGRSVWAALERIVSK